MTDLRELEVQSIRAFVQSMADEGYLSGRVLDYGCGKQPYRDIVEAAGGEYLGYDRVGFGGNVSGEDLGENREVGAFDWQAILCTQVVQYVHHVPVFIRGFKTDLKRERGHLVLTYPTCWPEVEPEDLHRFTKAGMERLLTEAGFTIIRHDFRHGFRYEGVSFTCGYGVVAQA